MLFFLLFCFFLFLYFCFFKNILINNSCWTNPVTSCQMAVAAIGIGIGLVYFQQNGNFHYHLLRPKLNQTNTWLECFFDLCICYLCCFCEKFSFSFCFYFVQLCKYIWRKIKGWITYWIKKKKER